MHNIIVMIMICTKKMYPDSQEIVLDTVSVTFSFAIEVVHHRLESKRNLFSLVSLDEPIVHVSYWSYKIDHLWDHANLTSKMQWFSTLPYLKLTTSPTSEKMSFNCSSVASYGMFPTKTDIRSQCLPYIGLFMAGHQWHNNSSHVHTPFHCSIVYCHVPASHHHK